MPTIVGILTFTSMINTTSERLKARNFFICRYFSVYEQVKFRAQMSGAWKRFYNLGANLNLFHICCSKLHPVLIEMKAQQNLAQLMFNQLQINYMNSDMSPPLKLYFNIGNRLAQLHHTKTENLLVQQYLY